MYILILIVVAVMLVVMGFAMVFHLFWAVLASLFLRVLTGADRRFFQSSIDLASVRKFVFLRSGNSELLFDLAVDNLDTSFFGFDEPKYLTFAKLRKYFGGDKYKSVFFAGLNAAKTELAAADFVFVAELPAKLAETVKMLNDTVKSDASVVSAVWSIPDLAEEKKYFQDGLAAYYLYHGVQFKSKQ